MARVKVSAMHAAWENRIRRRNPAKLSGVNHSVGPKLRSGRNWPCGQAWDLQIALHDRA